MSEEGGEKNFLLNCSGLLLGLCLVSSTTMGSS